MTTLSDLVTLVRLHTDTVNSLHITDTEIISYLNYSLSELYGKVIDAFEDYYVTAVNFTLDGTVDGYDLPADFFKEIRVDKSYSGDPNSFDGDWIRLKRVNIADESNYNSAPLRSLYYPRVFGYLIYNNRLKIVPLSEIQGSYRLLYAPAYKDYQSSDTVAIGPAGQHWEMYAVIDTCIKIAVKEESDPSIFMAQKADLIKRIEKEAANRVAGDPIPPILSGTRWYDDYGQGRWFY
jgi:hypothetical protein